jgi:predicted nucleic acid-binding protein
VTAAQAIIVDTNILFSALLRDESRFARLILRSEEPYFICESTIIELFKHKDRIMQASRLSEDDVIRLFYTLLRRVNILKEDLIPLVIRQQAYELCVDVDEADTPHVALTLHLDGLLWTGDERLKTGLRRKGFNSFFDPNV